MATALVAPAILLALWTVSSARGWLPDQLLPAPSAVWQQLVENAESGDLWNNTLISLQRVGEGFALGSLAGLLVGAAIGLSRTLHEMFDPLFLFVAQVPTLGWILLLILAVGIDEGMKVTVIAWASFVPVVLNVAQGMRDVPPSLRELRSVLTFDP